MASIGNIVCLTEKDLSWLKAEHPKMEIYSDKLIGDFYFHRIFNDIPILDRFFIEILLKHDERSMLPKVKCLDDRIKNIAKTLGLKMDQLHINSDGTFCLTVQPKERSFFSCGSFNLKEFFSELLEPYLYWICFYEKNEKAPWGEYSHGKLGILEFIAEENLNPLETRKILKDHNISEAEILSTSRQSQCWCNKQNKMRKCHQKALDGIKKIQKTLNSNDTAIRK